MHPTYEPQQIESRWYRVWEDAGVFRPEVNPDGDPYCIVIPPPNVTGVLHTGHALDLAMQDVIIRYRRMLGDAALWLPGTDHAGIATQNVVERELAAEGISRHDLGRERFVEQVWEWKRKSGGRITEQMRALGLSCDWSRERFTLDEGLSRAVRKVFVTLYEQGLIYRGDRIINWCPRCHTALSDIEVEHEDQNGELVHILYPFTDGPLPDGREGVVVATTRAETMLGDTAVAVHPDDERYQGLVGVTVTLPLLGRIIPIVADDAVDPEFGTGAVKVTPAHDPLDFEIAERQGLPGVTVIDTEARITAEGGAFFEGQDRYEAREAVKHALREDGVLRGIEDHHHSVGHCSRCGTVVEPLLSLQWFVSVGPLAAPAIDAVKDGRASFVPTRWEKSYFHWMENLRDWCISRQLWWGHRIPAWYCDCGEVIVAEQDPVACPSCGSAELQADEDVLDTWFSSGLWPFSTLGWPEETADFERFYPTRTLVTGFDIIYFWVARMMMMGLHFTGKAPFADIVIHGLVRDGEGRKMSKSLGNALDPLELIEKYGADSLRLALLQSAAPGQDVPVSEEWIDAARRFGNKVWNAFRFATGHLGEAAVPATGGYPASPGPEDRWILARLHEVVEQYHRMMDAYRFNDAVGLVYNFAWSEVFDWYLELAKTLVRDEDASDATRATLGVVLRDLLSLLHPFMPYVTEELWQTLVGDGLLAGSRFPEPPQVPGTADMDAFQDLVVEIRRFRSEHQISPRRPFVAAVVDAEGIVSPWWHRQVSALAGAELAVGGAPSDPSGFAGLAAGRLQVFISLEGLVDVEAERPRLEKAIAEAEGFAAKSQAKLDNPSFREKAPAAVVAKEEAKLAEQLETIEKLRAQLAVLG